MKLVRATSQDTASRVNHIEVMLKFIKELSDSFRLVPKYNPGATYVKFLKPLFKKDKRKLFGGRAHLVVLQQASTLAHKATIIV
jgi:hypothetical protein